MRSVAEKNEANNRTENGLVTRLVTTILSVPVNEMFVYGIYSIDYTKAKVTPTTPTPMPLFVSTLFTVHCTLTFSRSKTYDTIHSKINTGART